ncbi:acyloxyacyl hydrolase [Pacificibacter marinus]|uniref:acyloxyacyl hydrolase n=1 Tax=Pacificibacter marinus TaxID=658057 RepID=UPI0020909A93|nr:acyloxyacyl hydrolase [Pacificibacter marinus]
MAAAFLLFGSLDMVLNDCGSGSGSGCLAQSDEASRLSISTGLVEFNKDYVSHEAYFRYDFGKKYGPFQPIIGASFTGQGAVWAGAGAAYTKELADTGIYAQLHLMGGLFDKGDGVDIGGNIHFRSGVELGYEADNGWRYALSYDHRSNAELLEVNPGLETLQFRVSVPFN